jgi:(+)-trans-carveol dehydrogenase
MERTVPGRLDGKVALVTGAARGMGRAFSVRLAAEGADIVALDISAPIETVEYDLATPDELDETVGLVEEAGGTALAQRADVRDLEELEAAVGAAIEWFGHIDIVCANAGIVTHGLAWEMSEETWLQTIDINLNGVWRTMKAVVPSMIERGEGGSIIFTSSAAGLKGFPVISHYVAAKHGVVGLARTLALELGEHNIRVNTINPTVVGTPMVFNEPSYQAFVPDKANPTKADVLEVYRELNVLPLDVIEPADVAAAVAWLASDDARYVTGVCLPIDAGNLQK